MAYDNLVDPSALPPALAVPAATLAPAEIAAVLRFAAAAKAENTRRAYGADWADFCRWTATAAPPPAPAAVRLSCRAGRAAATVSDGPCSVPSARVEP
jgi:hypothetical protein